MELFDGLILGFSTALTPTTLLYCFLGVLLGTLIGVLPGLGPVPTIAMLLPLTYALEPTTALIMLAGIYYGAQYGGSTTAIVANLPGETSSVVTCLDGHQMARNGRGGIALATAAVASFFAGSVATVLIATASPLLAPLAFRFGPSDYFSLMVLGLIGAIVIASGSLPKALAMVVLGLFLGLIGSDVNSGIQRFNFRLPEMSDGVSFVILAMGIFGIGEALINLERARQRELVPNSVGALLPSRNDVKRATPAAIRGTAIGFLLGLLPGGGALLGSFAAYTVEKKISREPHRFGKGAIEGVAAPEAANNAGAQSSFIPLLTLGLPSNAVMALMLGAMMIHDIQPGPQVMTKNPALFWGLIASMWIGNLMLLVLNLPLIRLWVSIVTVPYKYLYPAILLFCMIGVYSLNNSSFDVALAIAFGLLGYVLLKLNCEPAPLLLGFVLGPLMEENLRRALLLSRGDWSIFMTRPISAGLLIAAALLILVLLLPAIRSTRQEVFQED